jgi:SAM-dependent methyltransferase
MILAHEVEMAYRLILGREPESHAAVERHCRQFQSLAELRESFLNSAEFRSRIFQPFSPAVDSGPPLSVETEPDSSLMPEILRRVEECWQTLGRKEPFWSVVSSDQFKSTVFSTHATEFYETGRRDVDRLFKWLVRNQIDPSKIRLCAEYGCGVGRVTAPLAKQFPLVYAYDISSPHLDLTAEFLRKQGLSNVTLTKISSVTALESLQPVDLIFSVIVLQHNPPPVMSLILRMLLRSLKPRGIAFFQIPTYALGYRFDARTYLKSSPPVGSFEMHVLPQASVFQIIGDEGCIVLEVQPDGYVGDPNWVSNTILVQRPSYGHASR